MRRLGSIIAGIMASSLTEGTEMKANTFGEDVAFLSKHVETLVLSDAVGKAKVAVTPAYQGRVMTSTTGGDAGPSFGWLNYPVIAAGIRPPEQRKGTPQDHIHVFGGEERFWMGPEGGQFSIFFKPGDPFVFDVWKTPAPIDTDAFHVTDKQPDAVTFTHTFALINHSGTHLRCRVDRTVRLLSRAEALPGIRLPEGVELVAYETDNRLTNQGDRPWTRESGLLSIWLLGMYKPSPTTTIVIPFRAGSETELGPKVNDAYFGKIPPEYLIVNEDVLFMRGDGTRRGKIGIGPRRSKGIAGSYDTAGACLTLVTHNAPPAGAEYVNSMWELQHDPFSGDVINAYNDGAPAPGQPPLGPFYEIETSSPAAALKPGETIRHISKTVHITGAPEALDALARATLGVGTDRIGQAFGDGPP